MLLLNSRFRGRHIMDTLTKRVNVQYINAKLFTGLLIIGSLSACGSEVKEHTNQVSYQTVVTQVLASQPSYQHTQRYTGTIRSANTTGVGFELAGKLNHIHVDSGNAVTKGQKLAALDITLLQAEQAQLQASLSQVLADINLAQSTLKRTLKLKLQNYVSEQQLDETQQQVASLLANQQRLKASLHATTLKIEKSTLLAPFSGKISQRHHNLGEVISLGSPVFTLVGQTQQLAYIGVPIEVAQSLKQATAVDVSVAKRQYQGQIAGISAEVNPISRTVQLRISLPDDASILNGEIAYLSLDQQVLTQGYWVPIAALTDGIRGLWNLYTLSKADNSAEGKYFQIERRDVEVIYTNEQQAYIKGAIKDGDVIITQGLHKLVVGQSVIPADAELARSL
jgi:multidrug efflux system membrane fusion protein